MEVSIDIHPFIITSCNNTKIEYKGYPIYTKNELPDPIKTQHKPLWHVIFLESNEKHGCFLEACS
jgi:hypothetical protein